MSITFEEQIDQDLQAIVDDPVGFMNRQPTKLDVNDNPITGNSLFSADAVRQQAHIDASDDSRLRILQPEDANPPNSFSTRAAIASNDNPANLVDQLRYRQLGDMENADLRKATLDESPWSDDYWAMYKGVLGARYADPDFPESKDWQENYDYVRDTPAATILASGNTKQINQLSPAEKYDALIGDSNETLTKKMWQEGKHYYDRNGHVETWMGICHGWAPAAYMLDRPIKAITVKTPAGIPITFYPSDIKSLASLLWANAASPTRFIGGRCNDKEPSSDPATGRLTASQCFDTNPGAWHTAVVNQIGVARRSKVLDVTFDYEVWNQPIYSYEYRYFNPQTNRQVNSLAEATVALDNYSNDKFSQWRSAQTHSVVGIVMRLSYVVETSPNHRETDSARYDSIQKVTYYYDLELDAAGNIIGGEWYQNKHPDFLWTPGPDKRAVTRYDSQAGGDWQTDEALPASWRSAAQAAASQQSAPLAAIVERLIQATRDEDVRPEPEPPQPDPEPEPEPPQPDPDPPRPDPEPPQPSGSLLERLLDFLRRLFGGR